MRKKGDLSDSECGRQAGDLYWDFHTPSSDCLKHTERQQWRFTAEVRRRAWSRRPHWGYSSYTLARIGQQIWRVSLKWLGQVLVQTTWKQGSILPRIDGSCWWCNGVKDVFSAHFGILRSNWASLPQIMAYLSIMTMSILLWWHVPLVAVVNTPCHKVQIISDWFLEHRWLHCNDPHSPNLSLTEHI